MDSKRPRPFLSRKLRIHGRSLVTVLAVFVCVCGLSVFSQAAPAGNGDVKIVVFHDANANGTYDAGDLIPGGQASLGMSGSSASPQTVTFTCTSGGYLTSLQEGSWRLASVTPPSGYYSTSSFQVEFPGSTGKTTFSYGQSFTVSGSGTTIIYIPVTDTVRTASVTGSILYTDTRSGMPGVSVQLVQGDSAGTPLSPTRFATTDANGQYRFGSVAAGTCRVSVAKPSAQNDVQYTVDTPLSSPFLVVDDTATTVPGITVSRATSVKFWMRSNLVSTTANIPFRSTISQPAIDASYLKVTGGGQREITGWYKDADLTQAWDFATDTVNGATNLYASWTTYYSSSSSSGNSGGSTKRDTYTIRPFIQKASATLTANAVILDVEMDGVFDVYDFDWQLLNENGYWNYIVGADTANYSFKNVEPNKTYTFRVQVSRKSDGVYALSDDLVVQTSSSTTAVEEASYVEGPPAATAPPLLSSASQGMKSGTLSLELSSTTIYEGGRLLVTPSVPGGEWSWDLDFYGIPEESSDATVFTALMPGTATLTYTLDDGTVTATVDVLPATLPATGQSLTPVYICAGAGALMYLAALALYLYRRFKGRARYE